jgi:hypothetical protein
MKNQFFVCELSYGSNHKMSAGGQYVNDASMRCSACGAFLRSFGSPEINIELNHIGKWGFTEYLWNSHSLPIFRGDLIDLWQKSNFSGFEIRPIHITGWYKKQKRQLPPGIPSYYELIATCKVKLLEPKPLQEPCSKCGFVQYEFPKIGNHLTNGIQIDACSWDGQDFFTMAGYNFLFCTRQVVEVTIKAGYSSRIAFCKAENSGRWEEFNINKWDPKSYRAYIEKFLVRNIENVG